MYRCLLVNTALAPGISTIVCVLSMIIAGPSTTSPTCNEERRNTGVSFTRPTWSKYTLYGVRLLPVHGLLLQLCHLGEDRLAERIECLANAAHLRIVDDDRLRL
ncbi:hypothetical protein A0H81_07101 [Grifola frondosa]|uniref:Uncharacterized protein n=1 Tax=Grifola frondosa TaxID=5627 RepID=A0A1C7M9L1_GRIFR|nr:hypothetical protein A0H81_07101 [Grifola frondosa]